VAVLPGEFLQLLSDGVYKAALHRVVRPTATAPRPRLAAAAGAAATAGAAGAAAAGAEAPRGGGGTGRLSAPLLMRASPASGFSGGARDGTLVGEVRQRLGGLAPVPDASIAPLSEGAGSGGVSSAAARIAAAKAYAQKKAAGGV
jgi:hypothetical protein